MTSTEPGAIVKMLSTLRRLHGLSQQDVAAKMGTTQSAVSDLESGRVEPRMSTLCRYAESVGAELRVTMHATMPLSAAVPEGSEAES